MDLMTMIFLVLPLAMLLLTLVITLCFWIKESCFAKSYANKVNSLISDASQQHPWLAKEYADLQYLFDEESADRLRKKKHPAYKAAEKVSEIAKEKREVKQLCKRLEYQIDFYESSFPWLIDYKNESPALAWDYLKDSENASDGDSSGEYGRIKKWLSPAEYERLPPAKKYQLALDRYLKCPKSSWEAGIAYERFIGFLYETTGYSVDYVGATMGLADRGIDIIATNSRETIVIQCKRYSSTKNHYVHENTVAQLYGVSAVYRMENPNLSIRSIIYTSSKLSDEAKHFAEYLGIEIKDNFPLQSNYPAIKCNISKKGEKIYHLPFDQQYDRVRINTRKGSKYVKTVAEAERDGFRHAFRWHPEN